MPVNSVVNDIGLQIAAATLEVSQLPSTTVSTDNNALTTWDGEPAVYDHWQCLNEYIDEPGVAVLPSSDPDSPNIKVTYGSRSVTLIRRWAAKRTGAPPKFPPPVVYSTENPTEVDENWVYIGGNGPQVRELGIAPNGASIVYEALGTYVFQALDSTKVKYIAEVPPALSSGPMFAANGWANTPNPQPSAVAVSSVANGVGVGIATAVANSINAPPSANNTLGGTQLTPPGNSNGS